MISSYAAWQLMDYCSWCQSGLMQLQGQSNCDYCFQQFLLMDNATTLLYHSKMSNVTTKVTKYLCVNIFHNFLFLQFVKVIN